MPLTDPYATVADYRARVTKRSSEDDNEILAQLQGISRYIDKRCGRHFTQTDSALVRHFDGNGTTLLRLPDGHDIASTAGLVVKADLDGDYVAEQTLTLDTHFWLEPAHADQLPEPEPWWLLQLIPSNGVLGTWFERKRLVEITAVWGWPQVPSAIREAVVAVVRQLRDIHESGFTLSMENIDQLVRQSTESSRLVNDLVRRYASHRVVFA